MNIRGSVNSLYAQVRKILTQGDFSAASIEKAGDKIHKFATQLEKQLEKKGLLSAQSDTDPLSLHASTSSTAIGDDTRSDAKLSAALVDYPNVTIGLAAATSVSVVQGGDKVVSSANFSAISGADFTIAKTYNSSGKNWQASTELVFAVDFKFLDDLNIVLDNQYNKVTKSTMSLSTGNVAEADFDVFAKAEHTSVEVVADVLSIEDLLSTSNISADLFIA